jgi:hypothetical protein
MGYDEQEAEMESIISALTDAGRLKSCGVSEEWVRNCADLIDQYRQLRRRFDELDAEVNAAGSQSSDDTIVF